MIAPEVGISRLDLARGAPLGFEVQRPARCGALPIAKPPLGRVRTSWRTFVRWPGLEEQVASQRDTGTSVTQEFEPGYAFDIMRPIRCASGPLRQCAVAAVDGCDSGPLRQWVARQKDCG